MKRVGFLGALSGGLAALGLGVVGGRVVPAVAGMPVSEPADNPKRFLVTGQVMPWGTVSVDVDGHRVHANAGYTIDETARNIKAALERSVPINRAYSISIHGTEITIASRR